MIIILNNKLKHTTMDKTRQLGGSTLERRVMELHKEGWFPVNIAHIAHIDIQTVREVLTRHKVILDGNGNPVIK